ALAPEKSRADSRPRDAQRVPERAVVTRREPVDEPEVDGRDRDTHLADAGADDDLALHVEAVGAKIDLANQARRVKPEAAQRIAHSHPGRLPDGPSREAVRHPAPRQHVIEE